MAEAERVLSVRSRWNFAQVPHSTIIFSDPVGVIGAVAKQHRRLFGLMP
jgi:hypothetical protein